MLKLPVEPRLRRVVADDLGVALGDLTPEVSLTDDLAADSLDMLELALVLEEEFGCTVAERVLSDVRTYGDLVRAPAMLASERRAEARGTRARARVIAAAGRGTLERSGRLKPYALDRGARQLVARGGTSRRWARAERRSETVRALGRPGYLRELPPGGRSGPPVARRH